MFNCFFSNCIGVEKQPESSEIRGLEIEEQVEITKQSAGARVRPVSEFSSHYELLDDKPIWENETTCDYRVKSRQDGRKRILKKYKSIMRAEDQLLFLRHINFLRNNTHDNIERVYDIYVTKHGRYEVVHESTTGCNLLQRYLNAPRHLQSISLVKELFQQILEAVSLCHQHGVWHGTLSPEKVVFVSSHPDSPLKLVGFCNGKIFNSSMSKLGLCNHFLAPENFKKHTRDSKADMWSCGIILFQMLTGRLPFEDLPYEAAKKGSIEFREEEAESLGESALDLVNNLLIYKPEDRISAKEALGHSFFSEGGGLLPLVLHEDLEGYSNVSKLREYIEFILIHEALRVEDEQGLLEYFRRIDTSKDGVIIKSELLHFINEVEPNLELANFLYKEMLPETQEGIRVEEFLARFKQRCNAFAKLKLEQLFAEIDEDCSGTISRKELEKLVRNLRISSVSVKRMMNDFQPGKDGLITLSRLAEFLANLYTNLRQEDSGPAKVVRFQNS